MDREKLIGLAKEAMMTAYAPYSSFFVGAALLAKNGTLYKGCNIENSAYSPSNCAERTAFFKAVSEGVYDFEAIAVVGGLNGDIKGFTPPCGVCRQVMTEFCDPDSFEIILSDGNETKSFLLKEILPLGFSKKDMI